MYVAFHRGMNLGRRRIRNEELCECFVAMAFTQVSAFLASGNVMFGTDTKLSDLEKRIEHGLKQRLNYEVPTFVRGAERVAAIADHQPFPDTVVSASGGKLQVALLSARPSASSRRAALALRTDEDHLALDDQELYWLPSGSLLDSDLDMKGLGTILGPMTIRTQRTVQRLAARLDG